MSESTESEVGSLTPVNEDAGPDQRRNYWATVGEGGAFIGGMAFLNTTTLLPDMVRQLGGSPLLIAMAPSLMLLGFWIAPVLTAHWVDGMHRYMPLVTFTGFFQRIPYLFAAIALWWASRDGSTSLALLAVVIAPLVSGIFGGISLTAWQQLIARCIPNKRRASLLAIRYIISCILGVIAGATAKWLFKNVTLLEAYASLHLIAFAFLMISYFIYLMTREPRVPHPPVHTLTLAQNLRLMPELIRGNPLFRRYLASRVLRNGFLVIMPFLAIYARQRLEQPESFLGTLLVANMLGAIVGNLGAAWLGDRAGGKLVHQIALALCIILAAWSIVAGTPAEFITIFCLLGASYYAAEVGTLTLMLEIMPTENRATYLALTSLSNLPGMAAASWISSAVWKHTHSITWLAIATIIALGTSMLLLQPIKEPRLAR